MEGISKGGWRVFQGKDGGNFKGEDGGISRGG